MTTHLRDPSHIIPGTTITKRLLFLDLKTHSEPLNFEIMANQKLTSGLFERMKWMDLALQKKILNNEPEPDGLNFEIFPLTSMLEFEEKEKLAVIGGKSPASVVRKILKKVLDKEFGKQFSWYGRRGNCSLGSSLLGKIILETATSSKTLPITETDAIDAAMSWLRHLKDKKTNAN
ncbi:hypothetical protein OUZ56_009946 [Daphnia magna]|uniref:DUF4806 domain-containing protein n=1 Tax=Daphnia magna TaxID=35525 RepID=A0ABR0AHC7_9CRUS|nr:hypothetical protein OUZ56_009946 [Daphnia magna]